MENNGLAGGGINAFGLDEFGQPDGNAMWGAFIGTGLGTVTAIGIRNYTKYARHAELIGMGAGIAAGAVMYFVPGMKASGVTAAVAALLNNGLRALEQKFMASAPVSLPAQGLRGVTIEPTQALGMIDIQPTEALMGATSDYRDMPQLVGATLSSAADHVQLVGGPVLAQQAGAWGATVMG